MAHFLPHLLFAQEKAMNRRPKSKARSESIRVWTYPQARQALPYVTSVMHSLRDCWLEAQRHLLRQKRLAGKPGRPDRDTLISRETTDREVDRAKEQFNDAYEELQAIEVYCLDPVQGVAAVPFVHDDRLAWLLYDLFDPDEYHHWRYHDDPIELRRPIAEAQQGTTDGTLVV
jgi:hypothetical protein